MTDKKVKTVNKAQLSNGEIRYYEDTFARESIENIEVQVNNISVNVDNKQDILTPGEGVNIYVDSEGNTIISSTAPLPVWGNIEGNIEDQQDLVEYVDNNGGKIDSISVNGVIQPIENKSINISVPTTVEELTDSSNYVTQSELQEAVSSVDLSAGNGITISNKEISIEDWVVFDCGTSVLGV